MDVDSEEEQDKKKRAACVAVMAACLAIIPVIQEERGYTSISRTPNVNRDSKREHYIRNIIKTTDRTCIDMTRMNRATFHHLCGILKRRGLLRDTLYVTVEEQLIMFLYTIGHSARNRVISQNFARSGETVSRYFNIVLRAIGSLKDEYIRAPASIVPVEIRLTNSYWPWFKDCIGGIDGTHVPAFVPAEIRSRFRGPEEYPTQNVMAAVNFDMTFSYVLAGWEGSAHDLRVLNDALERENGFKVPEGKYYLVNAGHTTDSGFLAPYKSVRYHLTDFSDDNLPKNANELFNLHHSSLRTKIEHALGVLKARFRLLTSFPPFPFPTQVDLVLVCCILHNLIMKFDPNDEILTEYISQSFEEGSSARRQYLGTGWEQSEDNREWCNLRDTIADEMWNAYINQQL